MTYIMGHMYMHGFSAWLGLPAALGMLAHEPTQQQGPFHLCLHCRTVRTAAQARLPSPRPAQARAMAYDTNGVPAQHHKDLDGLA